MFVFLYTQVQHRPFFFKDNLQFSWYHPTSPQRKNLPLLEELHQLSGHWYHTARTSTTWFSYRQRPSNNSHSLLPPGPHSSPLHNHALKQLEQLCVEFGVICLRYTLYGEYEQTRLVESGLLDYIVCLPWTMEAGSRAQQHACMLVAFLKGEMSLQPPSLTNLARAKLAVMHFGLRRIVKMSAQEVYIQYHKQL